MYFLFSFHPKPKGKAISVQAVFITVTKYSIVFSMHFFSFILCVCSFLLLLIGWNCAHYYYDFDNTIQPTHMSMEYKFTGIGLFQAMQTGERNAKREEISY